MSQALVKTRGEGLVHELITSETQGGFWDAKERRLKKKILAYMALPCTMTTR